LTQLIIVVVSKQRIVPVSDKVKLTFMIMKSYLLFRFILYKETCWLLCSETLEDYADFWISVYLFNLSFQ